MAEIESISNALESLMQKSESSANKSAEDYINPEDGLLWCGKCHTPKQCRVTMLGREYTPYCLCKCGQERLEKEKAEHERHERFAEGQRLKTVSGMSAMLLRSNFDGYRITPENQKAYVRCKQYAERFEEMSKKNQGLLLYGGVGTGKTFSAACIANCLLDRGISVVMTSFAQLLGKGKGFDIDSETVDKLNRARLLIIDDLGAERNTDFALEKVYSIIDSRYQSGLPMVLTTNLDLQEMQTCADIRYKRVYERVLEVCYPVRFSGNSLRKAEAANRFKEMEEFLK